MELQAADSPLSIQDVGVQLGEIIQAANVCLHSELPTAALCLLFVAIDTAASLDYRLHEAGSPRAVFVGWADRYLMPDGWLPCSALDLFGARCGLLHACSPVSDLSSRGEVRQIWYAFHESEADMLRSAVCELGRADVAVLSLEILAAVMGSGIARFISDLEADHSLAQWAIAQARTTFRFCEVDAGEMRPIPTLEDLNRIANELRRAPGST
jgi:hypothetical protein